MHKVVVRIDLIYFVLWYGHTIYTFFIIDVVLVSVPLTRSNALVQLLLVYYECKMCFYLKITLKIKK